MTSLRRRLTALVIATIWLSGCASADYSGCPPLIQYPPGFADELADELLTVKPDGAIVRAVTDYYVTRRMLEVCQ